MTNVEPPMSRTALAAVVQLVQSDVLSPMSRTALAAVFLFHLPTMSRMALATVGFPNDKPHRD